MVQTEGNVLVPRLQEITRLVGMLLSTPLLCLIFLSCPERHPFNSSQWLSVEANIDSDPLFVDPEDGDFRLREGSPCIDTGIAFLVWQGDTLVNLSRNDYSGSSPDMGAVEFGMSSMR